MHRTTQLALLLALLLGIVSLDARPTPTLLPVWPVIAQDDEEYTDDEYLDEEENADDTIDDDIEMDEGDDTAVEEDDFEEEPVDETGDEDTSDDSDIFNETWE